MARAWFDDPRALVVAATGAVGRARPLADGEGYLVSGRWPFGSGIHGATGVLGLCAVAGAAEPAEMIMCYAPADAATVIDTWHVSGLRGTGSCDWTLEEVRVQREHCFASPDHRPTQPAGRCRR